MANYLERNEISIYGVRIDKINALSKFNKKDGTEGALRSMQVSDSTKSADVMTWGEDVELLEGLKPDTMVDIINVKRVSTYRGKKQLHLSSESEVRPSK